jgi:hypothetical protein
MALSNYSELQAAVADWLNRTDLTNQIKDFIRLAEARFNREVKVHEQIVRKTATSSAQYVALPTDWTGAENIQVGTQKLEYLTPTRADDYRSAKIVGPVRYYTIIGSSIELLPKPTSDVTVEMAYYAEIPPLSDTNPTNWLLQKAPDIYYYGALCHAAPFLNDDQRLVTLASLTTTAIAALNDESAVNSHSGSTLIARRRLA